MIETPPGWERDGEALVKRFDCGDFDGAIAFVNAVAQTANRLNHHPDISVSWKTVTIRTWSHDTGIVTARDVALAGAIDMLSP